MKMPLGAVARPTTHCERQIVAFRMITYVGLGMTHTCRVMALKSACAVPEKTACAALGKPANLPATQPIPIISRNDDLGPLGITTPRMIKRVTITLSRHGRIADVDGAKSDLKEMFVY